MRRVFENLNELENFLKEEKDFLYKLIFYRIEETFDTNEEIILGDLTGNIEFPGSNYALGKHKVLHMESDGSVRTFTFPSGWVFYGSKPTETTASKKSILSLSCIGSAEADVRAVFVEEG